MSYMRYADFARTRGAKDKEKRKTRINAGGVAAVAGLGSVGLGLGAGAARYGSAELDPEYRNAKKARAYRTNPLNTNKGKATGNEGALRKVLKNKGARNLFNKDVETVNNARKGLQSAIQGSSAGRAIGSGVGKVREALSRSTSDNKYLGKTLGGNLARGGGLLATAGGAAAVLSYLKNKKKQKQNSTLRGRAASALSRLRGGN